MRGRRRREIWKIVSAGIPLMCVGSPTNARWICHWLMINSNALNTRYVYVRMYIEKYTYVLFSYTYATWIRIVSPIPAKSLHSGPSHVSEAVMQFKTFGLTWLQGRKRNVYVSIVKWKTVCKKTLHSTFSKTASLWTQKLLGLRFSICSLVSMSQPKAKLLWGKSIQSCSVRLRYLSDNAIPLYCP